MSAATDRARLLIALSVFAAALVTPRAQDAIDLQLVDRIKAEAFDRSRVMEHLYQLTDVHGPRLTGSPEYEKAALWAMDQLRQYGVSNVHREGWSFGRQWSLRQYSLELLEPSYALMTAVPLAWSAPTRGAITGEPVSAPLQISYVMGPKKIAEALAAYRKEWAGKLRGKIVLLSPAKTHPPGVKPAFRRYTETDLAEIGNAPEPAPKHNVKNLDDLKWPENPEEISRFFSALPPPVLEQFFDVYDKLEAERGSFFANEGVAAVLQADDRAHDGIVFAEAAGSFLSADPLAPATFVITAEQYDRVARAVDRKLPVRVRVMLDAAVSDKDAQAWNLVGEIPGTARPDEVVMIGAHFDSWHAGTGATDDAAGCAVMMEVMRILKTLNLRLDRTVRIGMWAGEEQGLLGSRAYVAAHFGDSKTMKLLPEHAKLSGYFNLDNGSGKIRGVYLQGNEAVRPLLQQWLAPFKDLGVSTITIRSTSGTDHLSFDAVGLPGFQFVQDPLDYGTIAHHSDMDTYDHVAPADLMQAAAVIATLVYETANGPRLLPRRQAQWATTTPSK